MSWPLASLLLVAGVLAVGWVAYERRRPSARMAAVVAVMAALAALGRDAFAALPDVKPITAMTLVVGYALGPIPGFTVGALGMLVSNFLLGQGPYTPWQMAAWGMVGLAGAALGVLTRRRLGRLGLACACALAALGAKEIMNVYTWTIGASHTPAALLAVAGQALAYDITDTVASFLFGLAFAPELARVLARTRVRMDVVWEPGAGVEAGAGAGAGVGAGGGEVAGDRERGDARLRPRTARPLSVPILRAGRVRRALLAGGGVAAVAVVAAVVLSGGSRNPAPAGAAPVRQAPAPLQPVADAARARLSRLVAFLASAQNADGGFGAARGQTSSGLYSAWAAMGLAAAGRSPRAVRRSGRTVLDEIRREAPSLQGAGDLERTILALRACGASVHSLPGGDLVARLLRARGADGSFGHLNNLTAFAILALRAAGYPARSPVVAAAASWLAVRQDPQGGFGFAGGAQGGPPDVDDTAAAIQALRAAGETRTRAVSMAEAFLRHAQNLDGGFPQQPGGESNAQSTAWAVQGIIAAGGAPAGVVRRGSRNPVAYLETLIMPNGSVRYSRTGAQTPVWVTAQALTALAGRPLPISPVRRG